MVGARNASGQILLAVARCGEMAVG